MRLYVGIGHPGHRDSVVDWVLGEPEDPDVASIDSSIVLAAAGAQSLLSQPVEEVMSELNSKR